MKRDGFQRTVKPQRIEREIGDAPSLGHLDRAFGKELPQGVVRKKRRGSGKRVKSDRKKRKLVIMTWSLVFAGCVLLIVVGMVWLDLRSNDDIAATAKTDDAGNGMLVASRFPSPSKDAARDLVQRALRIRDLAQVPEFFRIESATPAEVVGFLEHMAAADGPITGYQWESSMDANGLLMDGVLVHSMIGGKRRERLALLTPDDKGRWRVDFGAFARTVTPLWGEILNGSARQGVVRVLFVRDNYYNGPFGDESQWVCYRLGSPDLPDDLLGYCRKGSPQATAMKLIMANASGVAANKHLLRAILEIRRTEGAEARQFEITRVLAEDWVRSPEPFDKIRN